MGNLWRIARAEYLRLAAKRSFLLALVGMPLFIAAIAAVAIITATGTRDARPLGYVDQAGVTAGPLPAAYEAGERDVPLMPFAEESDATAALEAGEVQGYYVVPADYLQTRSLTLFTWGRAPSEPAKDAFTAFLSAHLVGRAPADVQQVLLDGVDLRYRATSGGRELATEGFIFAAVLPLVIGFFFLMVVMSSGGYLLQAVTTEKENRMAEVMMTTVSPLTLIGGKSIGLIGVALTQIAVWLIALVVALVVGARYVPFLKDVEVPWSTLAITAAYFLPTYVLLAGLMITVGSMVTELQHGQQISGFFNLLFAVPFFFLVLVFTDPDSPLMVLLTIFPTTSMMTVAMRWGVTVVPVWQVVLGLLLLVGSAIGSIWVAARVFRLGMLRYGQPLSLGGLITLLRPARAMRAAREAQRV